MELGDHAWFKEKSADYKRGWKAGKAYRNGPPVEDGYQKAIERADKRNEPHDWYTGFYDANE